MTPPPFVKLFRKIDFFLNDGFPKGGLPKNTYLLLISGHTWFDVGTLKNDMSQTETLSIT